MEIKLCPYCDQDDLWRVSIPGIDDNAVICKECDTIWTHDEKIEDGSGINFRKFMSKYGKSDDWKGITIKEKITGV